MSPYNYFPMNYQQPYYQQQPQQNNGGYVTVRTEAEARNYPVAPGTSVTFFNETQPYCYKKSAGMSPLDAPTFEIYQITKVEPEANNSTPEDQTPKIGAFSQELEALSKRVEELEKDGTAATMTASEFIESGKFDEIIDRTAERLQNEALQKRKYARL